MGTMMAPRAHARGGPEQLVYEQAPAPTPGLGEALIAVHAAAITFAELTWDLSWTTRDGTDRTPVIPSHEMSGTRFADHRRLHPAPLTSAECEMSVLTSAHAWRRRPCSASARLNGVSR